MYTTTPSGSYSSFVSLMSIVLCFLVSTITSSQIYSDLSISSLPSSESLTSMNNPFQAESSVTDLDETVKSPTLHTAREIVENYDVGVFDDETIAAVASGGGGAESQTEDDSDDEDEIEHFDQQSNLNETFSAQPLNLGRLNIFC